MRGEVAKQVQKEPGQLVLIFGGKILKDEDTLETHNIKDNNSVHLVIKNQRQVREKIDPALIEMYFQESSPPKTETSTPASTTPTSQPSSQPSGGSSSASQPSSNPFAGMSFAGIRNFHT